MSVNGVNGVGVYSSSKNTKTEEAKLAEAKTSTSKEVDKKEQKADSAAATYTKGETAVTGKPDVATIERMKAQAEQKTAQLRSLVEKMMTKQGQKFNEATDIFQLLREGKLEVDPEVAAQAKADIAEDGYWGVDQTSERLVSFAKALSGNDPSKAEELMGAIEEGFKQATKAWGDELPEICKKTLEATREKMNAWKNETATVEV
jgi:hypothetical protein